MVWANVMYVVYVNQADRECDALFRKSYFAD